MYSLRKALAASVVIIGVVVGSLGPVPPAEAASLPDVGVQFHATWSDYTDAQRAAMLDKLAAAGVRWVRIDVGWRTLEEAGRGVLSNWYVALTDRSVDMANARGIRVLVTLLDTPSWANGGAGRNVPPTDPNEFARIARWAAEHFRGRVAAWEVWNEPNLESFWAGRDPARYAALVRSAYPAFKAGDPAALVVAGSVSQNDTAWLTAMYDAGVTGAYDVLATHPYQGPADAPPELPDDGNPWILNHLAAVRALMVARGEGAKPIWATEMGWSSHPNTGSEPPWQRGVTEEQQADYLVRSLNLFATSHPYVENVFWYNDRNKATGNPQEDNYGILRRDLSDKPVYRALSRALAGSQPLPVSPPVEAPPLPSPAPAPLPSPGHELVIGAGPGGGPHVRVLGAGGAVPLADFFPYPMGFRGGVRVATGDVLAGSGREIVTGAGPGGGPHVRAFNPDGSPTSVSFLAYAPAFAGGVYVATGDVDPSSPGEEIVVGPGEGGGPHVRVFRGDGTAALADILAYPAGFNGGVRVATANVDGDPQLEIVTGAGPGGGPHVRTFNADGSPAPLSFLAYDAHFTGGVYVAGRSRSPGPDQVVTGAGEGGGPHVRVFDADGTPSLEAVFPFPQGFRGGVRVAGGDVDPQAGTEHEIITTAGPGGGPHVRAFDGDGGPVPSVSFFAYSTAFTGGTFVASGPLVDP